MRKDQPDISKSTDRVSTEIHFGSKVSVKLVRVFQIIFPLFAFALFNPASVIYRLLTIITFTVAEFCLSCIVFCIADETGIRYLRWKYWAHVKWTELRPPRKQNFGYYKLVAVPANPFWSRYLLLPFGPSLHEIRLDSEEDRVVRDRLQDGVTGRTN